MRKPGRCPITKAPGSDGCNILFMLTSQKRAVEMMSPFQRKAQFLHLIGAPRPSLGQEAEPMWAMGEVSDGIKAGFLSLPLSSASLSSLAPSQYFHFSSHLGSHFCSLSTQSCSSRLPMASSLSPDAQFPDRKMQKTHFPAPLGMATVWFSSNRCHISAFP